MSAITLYFVSLAALAVLCFQCALAAWLYRRARELNPDRETRDSLRAQIKQCQETRAQVANEVEELRGEVAKARQDIQKADEARVYLYENEDTVSNLKGLISGLKEDYKEVGDNLNRRKQELSEIEQKVQAKQQEHAELVPQCSSLRNECQDLRNRIAAEQARLEKVIRETREAEAQNRKQQNALLEKNMAVTRLVEAIGQQKKQLEALQSERKSQEERLQSRLREQESEVREVRERLSASEKEIRLKNAELKGIEEQLSVATVKQNEVENRWQDLERMWQKTEGKAKVLGDEEEWLKTFEANLKKYQILFHPRTIRAFHTGMKVADISPIVILAGVSGTGKSLLPRLYASALGMNFLQVAVQPRWDSPQDMLGFYNFMERRFKATELSRLLWQYDVWNNPEAAQKYGKSVPMNLVLLDEMNLARVEYYFSDLLSKLEVRRGLSLENLSARRAAEIEIECGAQERKAISRYLLPGFNTIFVGTMNEDETTQTLSDKVMDRANVLRFGKPSKLNVKPDLEEFFKEYGPERVMLPQGQKSLWHHPADSSLTERLQKTMVPINDALAKAGRPFAHRVWQAMVKYCEQYPGGVAESENAIADQLEMKILPKLNGLEKDRPEVKEVLDVIRNAVEGVGDEELAKAMNQSCDAEGIFFQWRGVMR